MPTRSGRDVVARQQAYEAIVRTPTVNRRQGRPVTTLLWRLVLAAVIGVSIANLVLLVAALGGSALPLLKPGATTWRDSDNTDVCGIDITSSARPLADVGLRAAQESDVTCDRSASGSPAW